MDAQQSRWASFAAGAALGAGALLLYTRLSSSRQAGAGQDGLEAAAAASAAVGGNAASGGGGGLAPPPAAAARSQPAAAALDMSRFDEDEVLEEQLTRNVQFFGREAQRGIGGAFVVVVGLGVRWRKGGARCFGLLLSGSTVCTSPARAASCMHACGGKQPAAPPL